MLANTATENSCREFFEYYEGSLILDWRDYRLVLFSGWSCLLNAVLFIEYDDITCSAMVLFLGS